MLVVFGRIVLYIQHIWPTQELPFKAGLVTTLGGMQCLRPRIPLWGMGSCFLVGCSLNGSVLFTFSIYAGLPVW